MVTARQGNIPSADRAAAAPVLVPGSGYIPALDGWRSIAIISVILCHYATNLPQNVWWVKVFDNGSLGVNLFFVISGYLICSRLIQEDKATGSISLKKFYIRRAFRILPPFLAFLAIVAILAPVRIPRSDLLSSVFFFRNYHLSASLADVYTHHIWSLSVEEHFYLLWPLTLLLLGSKRCRQMVLPLAFAIALWRFSEWRLNLLHVPIAMRGTRTDLNLDGLLWGCFIAFVAQSSRAGALNKWFRQRLIVAAAICVPLLIIIKIPLLLFWEHTVMAFLVLSTSMSPAGWTTRILEWQPLRWIGRISYSLYLWQQVFMLWPSDRQPSPLQKMPLSILSLFACAAASYYILERPCIRLGHRLARPVSEARSRH